MADNEPKQQPEERFREGNVVASVWQNAGPTGTYYNVTLSRSYQKDGATQWTDSLGRYDLTPAAIALLRAHKWIDKKLSNEPTDE